MMRAIIKVAHSYKWDQMSTHDLGLLLWALFRYYGRRAELDARAK